MLLDTFIQTHKTLKPMKKRYEFADFIPSRESVKDSKANVRVTKYNMKSHFDSMYSRISFKFTPQVLFVSASFTC